MSRLRRELPWERIEKDYVFEGPDGPEGVSREIRDDFLSVRDLQAVVRGVRRSLQELTE